MVTFHSLVSTALNICGGWKKTNPEINAVSLGDVEGMQRVKRDMMGGFAQGSI